MDKKDVLLVCQFYSPEYVTSAELAADTCRALADAGLSVDVLCGYPGEYVSGDTANVPKTETKDGVGIRRIKYLRLSRKSVAGRLINYFSFYLGVKKQLRTMKNYRVVAAYSNPPMVTNILNKAKKRYNVKTVFIAHDVYPEIAIKTGKTSENGIMARKMRKINRGLSESLDGVVCISHEMAGFFEKTRGIPKEKIATVPNWHRDFYKGNPEPDAKRPFKCGYFGNMGICQDMETITASIEKHRDELSGVEFVFAGHGNKAESIEKRLSGYANVKTPGFLRGEEFESELSSCDALVVSLEEGLGGLCAPSKVYSYYMMGKPVIAILDEKDIISDIEKYGCGIVVRNGDTEGFAAAVKKLAEDRSLAAKMGENARKCFLENYTKEKCCGELADFFGKLAGRSVD